MNNEICKCGLPLIFKETLGLVHYGKLECEVHGFVRWVPKPENEGMRRQTSKYNLNDIISFHKFPQEPFCFFCLRNREQLGIKETLTIDHILELSKDGENGIGNLQILCSACHKMKNWLRLYMNWHLAGVGSNDR